MDDSHTNFIPPRLTIEIKFEFKAKPFGDKVRVYHLKENGMAVKAGLHLGDTIVAINGVPASREKYEDTNYFYRLIQPVSPMILDIQRDGKLQRIPIPANLHTGHAIDYVYDYSRVFDWTRESETDYAEDPFEYGNYDGLGYVKVRNFVSSLGERPCGR